MKSDSITLFHIVAQLLTPYADKVIQSYDTKVDDDTLRTDVYDDESGKLILSANIYPTTRAMKEILFPMIRLN